jgi:hypothetical protein
MARKDPNLQQSKSANDFDELKKYNGNINTLMPKISQLFWLKNIIKRPAANKQASAIKPIYSRCLPYVS